MEKILIVVDMLNDFIRKDGALYCGPTATAIVPNVVGRVEEYRQANLPIIFLSDNHSPNDKEFDRFPVHCITGTAGAEIIKDLNFGKTDLEARIRKTRYSGFYNTALDVSMNPHFGLTPSNSIIELCGVCTSICVMDTVGGLSNRDYVTVIHRNCVADFDQEMHNMALKRMENLYGTVIV